eukprot:jgi/Chlat1/4145/Chrsp27S04226
MAAAAALPPAVPVVPSVAAATAAALALRRPRYETSNSEYGHWWRAQQREAERRAALALQAVDYTVPQPVVPGLTLQSLHNDFVELKRDVDDLKHAVAYLQEYPPAYPHQQYPPAAQPPQLPPPPPHHQPHLLQPNNKPQMIGPPPPPQLQQQRPVTAVGQPVVTVSQPANINNNNQRQLQLAPPAPSLSPRVGLHDYNRYNRGFADELTPRSDAAVAGSIAPNQIVTAARALPPRPAGGRARPAGLPSASASPRTHRGRRVRAPASPEHPEHLAQHSVVVTAQEPPELEKRVSTNRYPFYKYYGYGGQGARTSWAHNYPAGASPQPPVMVDHTHASHNNMVPPPAAYVNHRLAQSMPAMPYATATGAVPSKPNSPAILTNY